MPCRAIIFDILVTKSYFLTILFQGITLMSFSEDRLVKLVPSFGLHCGDNSSTEIARGLDFEYETSAQEYSFKKFSPSGLYVLDPRPAEEELSKIYPKNYLPYQFDTLPAFVVHCRNFVQRSKVSALKKLIAEDASILDVGCGNGQLLHLIKKFGSPHWKLTGNDFSEAPREKLEKNNIAFFQGPVQNITSEKKFDLIIMNQVIEHLPDVHSVLTSLSGLLKENGILLIETPSSDGWDAKLFKKRYWGGYHFPRHFYIFNEKNLSSTLNECGFVVKQVEYLASPSFWIQSIHHLVKENISPTLAKFFSASNIGLLVFFTILDKLIGVFGKPTSNMRVISQK